MSAPALPVRSPGAVGPAGTFAAPRVVAVPGTRRLAAFVPLALFALAHWMALVAPTARGALWGALFASLGAALVLLGLSAVADARWRALAVVAVTLGLLVIAFRLAGIPARLLSPTAWDDLSAGLIQGIGGLPLILVPYRGADEWVRSAMVLGGTVLTALAALLAFWPAARRDGARGGLAHSPLPAAIALSTLYAVPIVERAPQLPYLGGAVFMVLLAGLLWLERVRSDQIGVAAFCIVLAAAAGLMIAPRLDGGRPWLDYQAFAKALEPGATSTFNWNHGYGPMTWPRDGREVLRVRAPSASYWKATTLDRFDGVRWREAAAGSVAGPDTELARSHPQWFHTLRVVVRGMTTRQFIGAGTTLGILPPAPDAVRGASPGTFVMSSGGSLKGGASYQARVYAPKPSQLEMRAAGTVYPQLARRYLELELPQLAVRRTIVDPGSITQRADTSATLRFPAFGEVGAVRAQYPSSYGDGRGGQLLRQSAYARMYALVQRLKAGATSPYDFALRVEDRVRRDAVYSEAPLQHRFPLESFVFDDRLGYCQQFSGAMALMLRMGGVPARVASGFTSGIYDRQRREYSVSDLDAHSWVEVYFPSIGWTSFDPTPAAAPARAQSDSAPHAPDLSGARGAGGDRVSDPGASGPVSGTGGGSALPWLVAGVLIALGAGGGGLALVLARRRARTLAGTVDPQLVELRRVLRGTGRQQRADMTLQRLERTLAGGAPAAREYLQALGRARYAGRGDGPTPQQRRALRRELGAGLGLRGRVQALWALPPRLRRTRRAA